MYLALISNNRIHIIKYAFKWSTFRKKEIGAIFFRSETLLRDIVLTESNNHYSRMFKFYFFGKLKTICAIL